MSTATSLEIGAAGIRAVGQPEHVFELRFLVPPGWRPGLVDDWLREVLGVDPVVGVVADEGVDTSGEGFEFLLRVLSLALELMRVAGVPAFQPSRVLALRPNPSVDAPASADGWRARLAVPSVSLVPGSFPESVVTEALRWCAAFSQAQIRADFVAAFGQRIGQVIVQPLLRTLGRGKSTSHLLRTAHARQVPFFHLGQGVFQLGAGSRSLRVERSTIERDSAIGARMSQDKAATAELLRLAGLPAPRHRIVREVADALTAAQRFGWPLVVKPADRDRGEGVAVGVSDEQTLRATFETALGLSRTKRVIVERQVPGVCHRVFVAQGRLLYAVARHPMSVVGDGISTVRALVESQVGREALLPPWRRSGMVRLDDLALSSIAAAGFDESAIPEAGRRVPLRPIESTAWGGVDEDVTARVHPENLRVAIDSAALFGLGVAGIDIITVDISVPWHRSGAIVNEVNFAPLLGGGDISRACIPEFIERVLGSDGRIPIELFVGGDAAWAAALARRRELADSGLRAWAVCADLAVDASARPVPMALASGAFPRARAVALRRDVDAIVIAAAGSEAVERRWPIEYLDRVTAVVDPTGR